MKKVTLVFPGQGSQYVGMAKNLMNDQSINHVFKDANDALDYDLTKLMLEGPDTELKLTQNTQPAIVTHSILLLEKLKLYNPEKGKAFSYFGTIAKRYLIVYNENNYKQMKVRGDMEEVDEDKKVFTEIVREGDNLELSQFLDSYVKYMDENMENLFRDR